MNWVRRLVGGFLGGVGNSGSRGKGTRAPRGRRVAVEALEDRRLLSVVQQAADFGINGSSDPVPLGEFNGEMYFAADDGILGRELWKVDALGNVSLAADIAPGAASSDPLTIIADEEYAAYVIADDGTHGHELVKLDSAGNAALVADIWSGSLSSWPQELVLGDDGTVFFTARDSVHGREVWKLDRSGAVSLVADVNPGPNDSYAAVLTPADGGLYFRADSSYVPPNPGDPDYGETWPDLEWWFVDSAGNVERSESPYAEETQSDSEQSDDLDFILTNYFDDLGDEVYFNGDFYFHGLPEDPVPEDDHQPEWGLYRYDGELTRLTDFRVDDLTVTSGGLYFTGFGEDTTENVVYKVDTTGEVSIVVNQDSGELMVYNGEVYFQSFDAQHANELWRLDASDTYSLVADIKPGGSANPDHLVVFEDHLYFEANDAIWQMGSSGDLSLVAEIRIDFLTVFDGNLYYQGRDSEFGLAIWCPVSNYLTGELPV